MLSVKRNFNRLPASVIPGDVRRSGRDALLGMTKAAERIIVALDAGTRKEALRLARGLRDRIGFFKIGLQLYTAAGPDIVKDIMDIGGKVFLDLKLHDIPNTVAKTVESARPAGCPDVDRSSQRR